MSSGGFLRPGSKASSAFGLAFDRPARGDKGDGSRGAKRSREQEHKPPSSGSSSDSEGGGERPSLPSLNPTYRYGDPNLPVSKHRRQILYAVETHATTILVGETGSGKTTQVPQFLYEAGWAGGGYSIAVTQPRRVAAASVAGRVAEEMGVELGQEVGYAVRFDSAVTQGRTRIKYLTDGVLLREMLDDPLLTQYSVVMVDEAHERSLATDMLLGLIKKVQRRRPDLRLVVSSATLEAERLRDFLDTSTGGSSSRGAGAGGATPLERRPCILTVEGRTHPVQVHYLQDPCPDYVRAAVEAAVDIHKEDVPGDILIFLTGQEEVTAAVSLLEEHATRLAPSRGYATKLMPLPLYAGLPGSQQALVFRPAPRGYRKVVAATNVAETSLTLEGVVYVVDCCFVKQRAYNPVTGLESLLVAPLAKASAVQRAGRAGRVRAGHCFRLCTQQDYEEKLPQVAVPEMQRSNLMGMVLQLKALGVDNVLRFEWLSPPPAEALVRALEELHALGVLDGDARLTRDVGLAVAALPLEPPLAVALLASRALGCVEELLTLAALGSVQHVWLPAQGSVRALDEAKALFATAEGDGVTLLNVHRGWRDSGRSAAWAQRHFLSHHALHRADEARAQLQGLLRRHGLWPREGQPTSAERDMEPVCRALASGLFMNAAVFDHTEYNPLAPDSDPGTNVYRLVRHTAQKSSPIKLRIHNSSVLWRARPPCVVFTSVQQGDSGWFEMQGVTAIRPEWLTQIAPHMFTRPGARGA